jgi:hypothetical protein
MEVSLSNVRDSRELLAYSYDCQPVNATQRRPKERKESWSFVLRLMGLLKAETGR